MRNEVIQKIAEKKVITIVRGIYDEKCVGLAKALHEGGVDLMEVTFDQVSEEERLRTVSTIKQLTKELGDAMVFGAGTVTDLHMVELAREAGAQFIVSPNTDEGVIRATVAADMVSIPGALTPTEIKFAHDCGGDFIKVFPACDMGIGYFKNIHAPLHQVRLLAVGGISEKDAASYLAAGCSGIGVAGCLFKKDWVQNDEWARITECCKALLKTL